MKTSITILGRKTDLLLLAGIVILTVFITINTLFNGKKNIGGKLYALSPLKNKNIPVEIVSSHYVDPKGERVRS